MKVLWFSNTPANGDEYLNRELKGSGGWLKSLDAQLQNKVELHIAFLYKKEIEPFVYKATHYYPIYKKKPGLLKRFISLKNGEDFLDNNLEQFLEIINTVKPDLVHIHGTEGAFGGIENMIDTPVVTSIQGITTAIHHRYTIGIGEQYLQKRLFGFKGILGFKPFLTSYRKLANMAIREQHLLLNSKFVIGRTLWDQNITRLLAPRSEYYHSDELLRDLFYTKQWKPHKREKKIIFTTASNAYYKGIDTICEAVDILNRFSHIDFVWHIAGINNRDFLLKVIKKKLKNRFPSKNILFLGRLSESELIEYMIKADVYVMASHIENSPNNLCEAMILGMPCIATHAGGTNTILKDSEEGLLIQDADPWSMAGAILNLLSNSNLSKKYGDSARKRSLLRHNKERIVQDLVCTYKKIIQA